MMKQILVIAFLLTGYIGYAQRPAASPAAPAALPRVGILPITGVDPEDGENIARLLSNEPEIRSAFTVVIPHISASNILSPGTEPAEWSLIDGDFIRAVGKQLSLDFILLGHIQPWGIRKTLIITLIKVSSLQLIAGGYREFQTPGDIRSILPNLAKKIAVVSKQDISKVPTLAVLPFTLPPRGVSPQDGEALLQMLMIEVANTGRYAVVGRTKTVKTALEILATIIRELPNLDTIKTLSASINAQCILMGNIIRFEEPPSGIFFTQILTLENITLRAGGVAEYRTLTDGVEIIPEIVSQLTGVRSGMPQISISDTMVWISGGTFTQGSVGGEADEQPVHTVQVSSFYISKTPVTQKEYEAVMNTNPSEFKGETLPVEKVSWYDAVEYCNKLSLKEGLIPAYSGTTDNIVCNFTANGYRLPTEAEWEYAAKGGGRDTLYFEYPGGNEPDMFAWYRENSDSQTHAVGGKKGNTPGLYDMPGNVWEWCWDWYGPYQPEAQSNPSGPQIGVDRVVRGGAWNSNAEHLRSAYRHHANPKTRYKDVGFRILRPIF